MVILTSHDFLGVDEIDERFNLTLNLLLVNNESTQMEAVFEGNNSANATLLGLTPNGTEYAICTTLQYFGFKPSTAAATLTVEPQSTLLLTANKTPEQIQKEAMQNGTLSIWHEWSWCYPWYRLHYKLNVNLPQGNPNIDYGWSPLPFGASCSANNQVMANILDDISDDMRIDILEDFLVGVLIQFGTALALGRTLVGIGVAIGLYLAYNIYKTWDLYSTSGGKPVAWLAAFITSAFSGTSGAILAGIEAISGILTSTAKLLLSKISSILNSLWAKGLNFFDITGAVFALIDFSFMAYYISMYLNSL
ncbi:MAG: hypothetical protein QXI91_05370 [Candidatus Bathyarchaeia archaeon]